MGRKILFITTDQQRYDTLGCNGGSVARTPVIDAVAAQGVRYERAQPQSVGCMPSRSTMLTGQHPSTHGVWMNGVPLPVDAPSVASELHDVGYRTALIGKPHFQPFLDPFARFEENRFARDGQPAPHRGFEHLEFATHGAQGFLHYARWMAAEHPEGVGKFYPVLDPTLEVNAMGGGDTGAPQAWRNEIAREWYHTDWVADRTISWLDSLERDDDWFCWMSFPDPHHPWDPPAAEKHRVNWRDLPLPELYPGSAAEAAELLATKPRHWLGYFDGSLWTNLESPRGFRPCDLTPDQIREINAYTHIENELIDEACGRVLDYLGSRGWAEDTDIIFTTDHGELQGDYGLLFKGPYHVDALMRLPLIWRPAPSAEVAPAEVAAPVGHVDLASTFCRIAGIGEPAGVEGQVLPLSDAEAAAQGRERVLTEWASEHGPMSIGLESIYRDGWVCTAYRPGSLYAGSEGELYHLTEDPGALVNLWDDPARQSLKSDLIADLRSHLPAARDPRLPRTAPV